MQGTAGLAKGEQYKPGQGRGSTMRFCISGRGTRRENKMEVMASQGSSGVDSISFNLILKDRDS